MFYKQVDKSERKTNKQFCYWFSPFTMPLAESSCKGHSLHERYLKVTLKIKYMQETVTK